MRQKIALAALIVGVGALLGGLLGGGQPLIGLGAVVLFVGLIVSRVQTADRAVPATKPDDSASGGGKGSP